jgi:curved DNA-binding protein CbpA
MNFSNSLSSTNERVLRDSFYRSLNVSDFQNLAEQLMQELFADVARDQAVIESRARATLSLQSLPFFQRKPVNVSNFSQYITEQKGALYPELELLNAFSILKRYQLQFTVPGRDNYVKSTAYTAPKIKGEQDRIKKVPLVLIKGKGGKIIGFHPLPRNINIDELSLEISADEPSKKASPALTAKEPIMKVSQEQFVNPSSKNLLGNRKKQPVRSGNSSHTGSSESMPFSAPPSSRPVTNEDRRISEIFYQAIGTPNLSSLLQELQTAINQQYTVQACPSRPDSLRENTIYVFPSKAGQVKFLLKGHPSFDLSLGNLQRTLIQNCMFSQPVSLENAKEIIDLAIHDNKIKGEASLKSILDSIGKVRLGANAVNPTNFSDYMRHCLNQNALYPHPQILLAYGALKNKHFSFWKESNENFQLMDAVQYIAQYNLTQSILLKNPGISSEKYAEEVGKIQCVDLLVSDGKFQRLIPKEPTNIVRVKNRSAVLLKSAFDIAIPPPEVPPAAPRVEASLPGPAVAKEVRPATRKLPLKFRIVELISRNIPLDGHPLFQEYEQLLLFIGKADASSQSNFLPRLFSYLQQINASRDLLAELDEQSRTDSFITGMEIEGEMREYFKGEISALLRAAKPQAAPAMSRTPSLQPTQVNEPARPFPPPPPPRTNFRNVFPNAEPKNEIPFPPVLQTESLSLADRVINAIAKNKDNDLSKVVFWGMCNNSTPRRGTMRTGFGFEYVKLYLRNIRAIELLEEINELSQSDNVNLEKEVYGKILSNFLREIDAAREDFLNSFDPSRRERTTRKQSREESNTNQNAPAIPSDAVVLASGKKAAEAEEVYEDREEVATKKIDRTEAARLLKRIKENKYYEVLGLEKTATDLEIKKAYRRLALYWHPDKNPGEEAIVEDIFKGIVEANSILGDPDLRGQYNESLQTGTRIPSPPPYRPEATATPAKSNIPSMRYSRPPFYHEAPPPPAPLGAQERKAKVSQHQAVVLVPGLKRLEMTEEAVLNLAARVVRAIDKKQELAFPAFLKYFVTENNIHYSKAFIWQGIQNYLRIAQKNSLKNEVDILKTPELKELFSNSVWDLSREKFKDEINPPAAEKPSSSALSRKASLPSFKRTNLKKEAPKAAQLPRVETPTVFEEPLLLDASIFEPIREETPVESPLIFEELPSMVAPISVSPIERSLTEEEYEAASDSDSVSGTIPIPIIIPTPISSMDIPADQTILEMEVPKEEVKEAEETIEAVPTFERPVYPQEYPPRENVFTRITPDEESKEALSDDESGFETTNRPSQELPSPPRRRTNHLHSSVSVLEMPAVSKKPEDSFSTNRDDESRDLYVAYSDNEEEKSYDILEETPIFGENPIGREEQGVGIESIYLEKSEKKSNKKKKPFIEEPIITVENPLSKRKLVPLVPQVEDDLVESNCVSMNHCLAMTCQVSSDFLASPFIAGSIAVRGVLKWATSNRSDLDVSSEEDDMELQEVQRRTLSFSSMTRAFSRDGQAPLPSSLAEIEELEKALPFDMERLTELKNLTLAGQSLEQEFFNSIQERIWKALKNSDFFMAMGEFARRYGPYHPGNKGNEKEIFAMLHEVSKMLSTKCTLDTVKLAQTFEKDLSLFLVYIEKKEQLLNKAHSVLVHAKQRMAEEPQLKAIYEVMCQEKEQQYIKLNAFWDDKYGKLMSLDKTDGKEALNEKYNALVQNGESQKRAQFLQKLMVQVQLAAHHNLSRGVKKIGEKTLKSTVIDEADWLEVVSSHSDEETVVPGWDSSDINRYQFTDQKFSESQLVEKGKVEVNYRTVE